MTDKLMKVEKIEDDILRDKSMGFAYVTAGKKSEDISRTRVYTRDQIRKATDNPIANYLMLQETSNSLAVGSGIYFRMWKYLSEMLTFDHWIYPSFNSTNKKLQDKESFWKEYETTARRLNKYNIKYNCQWWIEKIILHGELYLYKIDDGVNIVYSEFPTNYCRIAEESNGVLRFEVNLDRISPDEIREYPLEIKKQWNLSADRINGKKSKEQKRLEKNRSNIINNTGDWFLISPNGVAFSAQYMQSHGYPFLTFIFDDVMRLDDAKDETENNTKANNFKLIHNKIGIDKDTKKPVVSREDAQVFHNETKKQVPEGVGVSTNVFDVTAVTLQNKETNSFSLTKDAEANLWSGSGFSQGLFSVEKPTGEGIKKSTTTDEMLMYPFLRSFENYFNQELSRATNSWAIHFINSTHQNITQLKSEAKDNLAYGGSRMEFIATCGETPFEFIKRTQMERALNIDEYLIPKMTSHTLSGTEDEGGAPTVEESGNDLSDAGETNREYK